MREEREREKSVCVCVFRYSVVGSQTKKDSSKFEGFSVNFFCQDFDQNIGRSSKDESKS